MGGNIWNWREIMNGFMALSIKSQIWNYGSGKNNASENSWSQKQMRF